MGKVTLHGMTEEHLRIFVETLANIKAKHVAPDIEVKVKITKKK